ncbi:hypothetical protein ACQJBY_059895 [Aegilops geniculata]
MLKRRPIEKPQHLYLVLNDWSWGYSIRKIYLTFGDERRGAICTSEDRLLSTMFCLQGRRGEPKAIMGAFDNMILAMPPLDHIHGVNSLGLQCGAVIDIHARTFINGPWQDTLLDVVNPICIPVGGKLFFLDDSSSRMLYQACDDAYFYNFVWSWSELPKPIFQCELVTSYAVHPDERTIFVSGSFDVPTTFSINTIDPATISLEEHVNPQWKQHGMWQLPFTGRGYFDPELDAWVGLSAQLDTMGHICSCDVVSTNSGTSHQQCPALKVSKENLFSEFPDERRIGATLVYMGGESKFCLLEVIYMQGDLADKPTESDEKNEDFDDGLNDTYSDETTVGEAADSDEMNEYSANEVDEEQDQKRFLRLTTFSLRYDRNGDLATGNSRRVRYYSLPQGVNDSMLEYPVAFWM